MPPHSDGRRRLSIVIAGGMLESARTGRERPRSGSVALKAPRFEHADRFGDRGALILSVLLPDSRVRALGYDPDRLAPWRWRHAGTPSLAALRLAAGLRERDASLAAEGILPLLAAFSPCAQPRRCLPERVRRVQAALHDEPAAVPSPTPVEVLAEREGVHPVSLGRLFRRHLGCSITRYRRRLRIHAAARRLMETPQSLVEVALDHGYADLSHMTRRFSAELGLPPGRFRNAVSQPAPGLDSFKTEWTVSL
jgi:AraC-like DNA-binding protein